MKSNTHQFQLGAYQCSVIKFGYQDHTVEQLIINATNNQLEKAASDFGIDLEKIPVGYNCLLVKTSEQNVLIDSGFWDAKLLQGLNSLGLSAQDIDSIIITHTDYDHIGGILSEECKLIFPNARYFFLDESWELWSTPEKREDLRKRHSWPKEKTEFVWETLSAIRDKATLVRPEEEFLPGFQMIPAPGHRYDHAVVKIESDGEHLLHAADGVVHPIFIPNPEWVSTYDTDPELVVKTRESLLEMCAVDKALLFGSHFPLPGIGRVQKGAEDWEWVPIQIPSSK